MPGVDENFGDFYESSWEDFTYDKIPLTTGAVVTGSGEIGKTATYPKGATFVLDEGTYVLPDSNDYYTQYIVVGGSASATPPAPALTAKPTASKILVNGETVAFDAYNISDNNYFKLRDLAYVLNGTEKQFEIGYDDATKAITLTSGQAYTPNGSELVGKGDGVKTPKPTASKIYLDGEEVNFTVYIIEGNNYFKLRDVGEAFGFGVDYDSATKTIAIDTSKAYTPE